MTVTRSAKERLPRLYTPCCTTVFRRIWRVPGAANHTCSIFSITTQLLAKGFKQNSPNLKLFRLTAMAKLAMDSASLETIVINREIFIPNREIGRFSLCYQKSGDLPPNRETWKLCGPSIKIWRNASTFANNCYRMLLQVQYIRHVYVQRGDTQESCRAPWKHDTLSWRSLKRSSVGLDMWCGCGQGVAFTKEMWK